MITFADTGIGVVYPVTVESETPVVTTESLSLSRQTVRFGGQRFTLSMELYPQTVRDVGAGVIQAHIVRHGTHRSFTTVMPQPIGLPTLRTDVVYTINGAHSAGADTIRLNRTTAAPINLEDSIALMGVGRYLRLDGKVKIHQITALKATGIDIYPPLREDIAGAGAVSLNPSIQVTYAESSPRGVTINGAMMIPQVQLIESV